MSFAKNPKQPLRKLNSSLKNEFSKKQIILNRGPNAELNRTSSKVVNITSNRGLNGGSNGMLRKGSNVNIRSHSVGNKIKSENSRIRSNEWNKPFQRVNNNNHENFKNKEKRLEKKKKRYSESDNAIDSESVSGIDTESDSESDSETGSESETESESETGSESESESDKEFDSYNEITNKKLKRKKEKALKKSRNRSRGVSRNRSRSKSQKKAENKVIRNAVKRATQKAAKRAVKKAKNKLAKVEKKKKERMKEKTKEKPKKIMNRRSFSEDRYRNSNLNNDRITKQKAVRNNTMNKKYRSLSSDDIKKILKKSDIMKYPLSILNEKDRLKWKNATKRRERMKLYDILTRKRLFSNNIINQEAKINREAFVIINKIPLYREAFRIPPDTTAKHKSNIIQTYLKTHAAYMLTENMEKGGAKNFGKSKFSASDMQTGTDFFPFRKIDNIKLGRNVSRNTKNLRNTTNNNRDNSTNQKKNYTNDVKYGIFKKRSNTPFNASKKKSNTPQNGFQRRDLTCLKKMPTNTHIPKSSAATTKKKNRKMSAPLINNNAINTSKRKNENRSVVKTVPVRAEKRKPSKNNANRLQSQNPTSKINRKKNSNKTKNSKLNRDGKNEPYLSANLVRESDEREDACEHDPNITRLNIFGNIKKKGSRNGTNMNNQTSHITINKWSIPNTQIDTPHFINIPCINTPPSVVCINNNGMDGIHFKSVKNSDISNDYNNANTHRNDFSDLNTYTDLNSSEHFAMNSNATFDNDTDNVMNTSRFSFEPYGEKTVQPFYTMNKCAVSGTIKNANSEDMKVHLFFKPT